MKGRKPIPTAIKILKGTAEKSRINPNEYKPEPITQPIVSEFLKTDYELKEWECITAQLISDGLLTGLDISIIEAYCIEMGKYKEAIDKLTAEGKVLNGKKGLYLNPYHLIAERSLDRALKIGVLFGVTPSARSRVSTTPKKKTLKELLKETA